MIVSARSGATGRMVILSGLASGSIGTVSVTTMPLMSEAPNFSSAFPQKRPWVAKTQTSSTPCSLNARTFASSVPPVMITSSPRIAVLPRVGEQWDDRGDPLRGRELRRLNHEQQLHDVAVDGLAAGLDDEDVGAADRLVETAVRLAVRERAQLDLAELDAELGGDPLR